MRTDRTTIWKHRNFWRWLKYGERRYIPPPELIDLRRDSGLPYEEMRAHSDAAMLIRVMRKRSKPLTVEFVELWWKTRGYRLV